MEEEARREFGPEARRLWTAGGRSVGYLRSRTSTGAPGTGRASGARRAMAQVLGRLEPGEDLVIDLTGNPGAHGPRRARSSASSRPPGRPSSPRGAREERRTLGFVRRTTRSLRSAPRRGALPTGRVLVLVDQRTQSAAEITERAPRPAGAELVGERTAGAEFSTGHSGPDGSTPTIGLAGGMVEPCEHFRAGPTSRRCSRSRPTGAS